MAASSTSSVRPLFSSHSNLPRRCRRRRRGDRMLAYNLRIAFKSLRRHPLLTGVIIAGIALGISASTTFTTVRHMFARDPLPGRSSRIFYVRMDNWDPATPYPDDGTGTNPHHLPPQVAYRDAMEL